MTRKILIAGNCVIETYDILARTAEKLKFTSEKYNYELIFKSSFDKANRTSRSSYRGVGLSKSIKYLSKIKKDFDIKITTDIHLPEQAQVVSEVVDVIQIPAFLCRQTDLLIEAAKTGKIVNIKKGQFLSPNDLFELRAKLKTDKVIITERGTSFGYDNLVVDFTVIGILKKLNCLSILDISHSLKNRPKIANNAKILATAGLAVGFDGIFLEVHPNPNDALCDSSTSLDFMELDYILETT